MSEDTEGVCGSAVSCSLFRQPQNAACLVHVKEAQSEQKGVSKERPNSMFGSSERFLTGGPLNWRAYRRCWGS